MKLALVWKANEWLPKGTWLREFEEGFQRVEVSKRGPVKVQAHVGLLFPKEPLEPYITRVSKGVMNEEISYRLRTQ
jgi:hypothetical protein